MTIKEALFWAIKRLKEEEVAEPKASAELLLCDVLEMTRTELATHSDQVISLKQRIKYELFINRRTSHEPVWQIIGKVDFWGMSYLVDKNVLVPRPETEILVTEVLKLISDNERRISIKNSNIKQVNRNSKFETQNSTLKVLDLGTGSGTIVIALASELPESTFFASDISPKALKIAKKNATNLLISRKVIFKQGDLLEPWVGEKFDIICANLPYIPHEDMSSLAFDVLHHEPRVALDGGAAGLELYEKFFKEVSAHLRPGGAIFCEIGIKQGDQIKTLVKKYLPEAYVKVLGDLAGIDRVAVVLT